MAETSFCDACIASCAACKSTAEVPIGEREVIDILAAYISCTVMIVLLIVVTFAANVRSYWEVGIALFTAATAVQSVSVGIATSLARSVIATAAVTAGSYVLPLLLYVMTYLMVNIVRIAAIIDNNNPVRRNLLSLPTYVLEYVGLGSGTTGNGAVRVLWYTTAYLLVATWLAIPVFIILAKLTRLLWIICYGIYRSGKDWYDQRRASGSR